MVGIVGRKFELSVELERHFVEPFLVLLEEELVDLGVTGDSDSELLLDLDDFSHSPLHFHCACLEAFDTSHAVAVGTPGIHRLTERLTRALPRHLDKAKFAHPENRALGPIGFHAILESL